MDQLIVGVCFLFGLSPSVPGCVFGVLAGVMLGVFIFFQLGVEGRGSLIDKALNGGVKSLFIPSRSKGRKWRNILQPSTVKAWSMALAAVGMAIPEPIISKVCAGLIALWTLRDTVSGDGSRDV